jgi:hypothetical protein
VPIAKTLKESEYFLLLYIYRLKIIIFDGEVFARFPKVLELIILVLCKITGPCNVGLDTQIHDTLETAPANWVVIWHHSTMCKIKDISIYTEQASSV